MQSTEKNVPQEWFKYYFDVEKQSCIATNHKFKKWFNILFKNFYRAHLLSSKVEYNYLKILLQC